MAMHAQKRDTRDARRGRRERPTTRGSSALGLIGVGFSGTPESEAAVGLAGSPRSAPCLPAWGKPRRRPVGHCASELRDPAACRRRTYAIAPGTVGSP